MVALTSSKDRVNYFPCSALSILPEVRWDCVSRLLSGRTLGGDRSNSDQESLNSKVGLTVAVVVIDRVWGVSSPKEHAVITTSIKLIQIGCEILIHVVSKC